MPKSDKLKKMIVFSTEKIKEMVEAIISDTSEATRLSGSALIENYLLDAILPSNEIGRDLYTRLYSGTDSKKILEGLFSSATCGANFEGRWDPDSIYPFIEYAKSMMVKNHWRTRGGKYNDKYWPYLESQLKTFIHIFEKKDESNSNAMLKDTIKYLADYIRLSNENIEEIRMSSYIQIIQDNWYILKNSTYTYRALMAIMQIEYDWDTTTEERYQLGELIKKYSPSWT